MVNADGRGERLLPTGDTYGNPRWSPDGTKIVYDQLRNRRGLAIVNAIGTHRTVIPLPVVAREPDWSPNGKQLAFTGGDSPTIAIYVVNVDGSGFRKLTQPLKGVEDDHARWSPDGRTLMFIREGGAAQNRIYTMSPRGGTPKLVFGRSVITSVSWSPDGKQIAYAGGTGSCCQIHVLSLAGASDRLLKLKPCVRPASCQHLDWQRLATKK